MTATIHHEALRFLVAGVVNTTITYLLYYVLLAWMGYLPAYTIAYVFGIALAYALNTRFVFRVTRTLSGAIAFPLVYVVQYLVGALILALAVHILGIAQQFALLVSLAVTVPLTFAFSRRILTAGHASRATSTE